MRLKVFVFILGLLASSLTMTQATEYHVAVKGSDDNPGTMQSPFKTIAAASRVARAGDTVTVHAGTYREWVDPLYGGTNHLNRIVYRAAKGEEVFIKGSEQISGWERVGKGVWKVTLDNRMFGDYNPYQELVRGDWFLDQGRKHHTGEVYLNGQSFFEIDSLEKVFNPKPLKGAQDPDASLFQWYCESNSSTTFIWANFHDFDPNKELVEINVRPAVFYPKKTGINYITVSGFHLSQAATNWAPPTAEQTGLIGPHWSKGWIIENNVISHSKCSGISLGKGRSSGHNYSTEYGKKSGHIVQLEAIFHALQEGWSKETVGSHVVRDNTIFSCEQTGICGNLGAIFSEIEGNHIYDIYVKRQWGGFEMGGIKLHAPIDVVIKDNCIHDAFKGMWIDWQAQGIRISGNLMFDNSWMDIHLEVSHGPHIIDNNLFLSDLNLWNMSTGSAFVHNLYAGQICKGGWSERFTPFHFPHSTQVAGIMTTMEGDDRWLNNVFLKRAAPEYDIFERANRPKRKEGTMDFGLGMYHAHPQRLLKPNFEISEMSTAPLPVLGKHNLYLNGAMPLKSGVDEEVFPGSNTRMQIEKRSDGLYLILDTDVSMKPISGALPNSYDFGEAMVPQLLFEGADGNPIWFDRDFLGNARVEGKDIPGPFQTLSGGATAIKVWPKK